MELYCRSCTYWEQLAQPGPKSIGWCPKTKKRKEETNFCIDHFHPKGGKPG